MNSRLSFIRLVRCRSSFAFTQRRGYLSMTSQMQRLSTAAGSSPAHSYAMRTTGAFRHPCAPPWHVLQQHHRCQYRVLAQALQAEQRRGLITCRTAVADAAVAEEAGFLAPASMSYKSLGLHPAVQEALQRAGYSRPAQVQALSTPPILEGKSVVLAAETGSGKTLAYLVPVISALIDAAGPGTGDLSAADAVLQGALILCPNAALCDQVVKFANQLRGEGGEPLVRTARVAATHPPPRRLPHIVVATPAGLINATREFPDAYGRHWTKDGIIARMHWVVVDEADLLLTGGFKRDVRMILSSMKEGDRIAAAESICHELGMEIERFWELPRALQRTAIQGGVAALLAAGFVPPSTPRTTDIGSKQPSSSSSRKEEDWPQEATRRRSWSRQLIFVAATMPSEGDKSVATELQQVSPDAIWLSGERLHQPQSQVHHSWHRVTEETWKSKLQEVVVGDEHLRQGKGRMLVFAGTVASAESAAAVLREAGLTPLIYHREIPAEERENILSQAASRDGIVLVCTDAAARGIDIPHVTHVVQADFAGSAVDFLHRVGRTGRAGQRGKVTSLYLPGVEVLAEAIQDAVEAGEPIEGAFSRNRSFRKKLHKYGRYVPRGQVA